MRAGDTKQEACWGSGVEGAEGGEPGAKCSVVERVIAQIKIWRVLHTGFRRSLRVYGRAFSSGAGLVFFGVGAPLCITLSDLFDG